MKEKSKASLALFSFKRVLAIQDGIIIYSSNDYFKVPFGTKVAQSVISEVFALGA
ncbi:hypothetical protein Desdi_2242 [Desulfitobacterium dichloroeliminans LMG P-21439]|uniref:Uncharacterized protein n=1 Tax=Desulfitobacterium dichloroeliminans (strain LMG P-21439 / DCA1) TaxID=871963 RepID=L0F9Q4_DESDL|nr:hypothetical protein Desdi_2242 [Desulfitobacterium dichloroeliminans LMG P-21439]